MDTYLTWYSKMAWIQVRDVERFRNELAMKVDAQQEQLSTLEEKMCGANAKEEGLKSKVAEIEQQMNNMRDTERTPIEERAKLLKTNFEEGRAQVIKFQTDQRECHSVIKRQDRTIETTKEEIEKETKALAENEAGIQRQRFIDRRVELDEIVGGLRDEIAEMDLQMTDINTEIGDKAKELVQAEQSRESSRATVDNLNERLDGIRRASKDKMSAYHNNMDRLLRQIQEANKRGQWKEIPVGPMGLTMTLKYPEWSDIVESFWGARINGFLVSDYEDKQLLLRLMNSAGVKGCPVLQGKNNVRPACGSS